jgi:hypothetical protein
MAEFTRTIVDVATGETISVPFTAEEIAAHLAEQERLANLEAETEAKAEADKLAREALLEKLGLTEEEARLLLG